MKFVLDKNFRECYFDYSEWKNRAERRKPMSEIEKTIAEELAKVPVAVREKFLLMAQGAAVAVECAREAENEKKGETQHDAE